MFFGAVPIGEALGGTAVHSVRQGGLVLKKGTVVGSNEIAALESEGIETIVIARLAPGDVGEDEAAARLAAAVSGDGVRIEEAFTGRANLFADVAGVLEIDAAAVDRLNAIDEALTFATLPALATVEPGEMIGTVKVIPFAVPGEMLNAALLTVTAPLIRVRPFRAKRVAVVSTLLPGLKPSVVDKTLRVLEERLAPAGAPIISERRVPHEPVALAAAIGTALGDGADLIIVFGASAIADRRDVIPAAIEVAGGRIEHFGMPVDPGNLLLVGRIGAVPVLGAPGCARSPKENGFDWVLHRLLADIPVTRAEIVRLGVGGLLMEIVTRPQPRAGQMESEAPKVAAVVLAAGRSTRMGGPNKLLEPLHGKPLVRHAVEAALGSSAKGVTVVTGHMADEVRGALAGLDVRIVHNPDFAKGLSTSVRAGIAAIAPGADGAVVCLGDMPAVDAGLINRLIAAFEPAKGALAVMPTLAGKRGNPVLWARRFFPDLLALEGDEGARRLLAAHADAVVEVAVETDAIALDIDTPEALAAARSARP